MFTRSNYAVGGLYDRNIGIMDGKSHHRTANDYPWHGRSSIPKMIHKLLNAVSERYFHVSLLFKG